MEMQPRLDYTKAFPGTVRALFGLEVYLHRCGLEHRLLHLVKLRASQINGCAYGTDMHSRDARAAGETEQRLYLLDAWREAPFHSDRGCAAFAWTEAVTKVTEGHVPDAVFEEVHEQFNDKELADLSMAIAAINAWNRMAISFRDLPGGYRPGQFNHLLERQAH
jgi:AhpD family alkylhydroperoxidase